MAFKSSVPDSSTGNGGGFVPAVRVGKRGVRVYIYIYHGKSAKSKSISSFFISFQSILTNTGFVEILFLASAIFFCNSNKETPVKG
jgi:hypothetical protein